LGEQVRFDLHSEQGSRWRGQNPLES
jgi:hypothetical protein